MPFEMTFLACSTLATLMLLQADAASPCLPDAIPVEDRRKIANLNGTGSVPFGLWVLDWDSAVLAAHLVKLLAEEALGYHSAVTGLGGSSPSGLYATAGCRAPNSFYTDPLCSNDPLFIHHASLEIWGMTSLNADSRLSAWPAISPDDVGDMGYKGVDGMYILTREREEAYASDGLALEYYRNYNASWRAPHVYFDSYASIDPAALKPCSDTRMVDAEMAEHYLALTGDLDGVVNNSGKLIARCWNTSWWFAPSCRNDPMRCIPTITGGSGWAIQEFVQRAGAYNMPLAVAVAMTWSSLPRTKRVLPYWWQPDATFIDLKPSIVMFPPYNEIERAANVKTSMTKDVRLSKWVHNQLVMKAPQLSDFVAQVRITPSSMDELLSESKRRGGSEPAQVACDWLRTNRHLWKSWIPVASQCASGFGLADGNGTFQLTRTDFSTCSLCPSGKYSDPYRDNIGPTHLCKECPNGTSTESQGNTECFKCRPGFFAPAAGSTSCEACPKGEFSKLKGSSSCSLCSGQLTTQNAGASCSSECHCPTGFYRPANGTVLEENVCKPCPEGMECGFGSDMNDRTRYPELKPRYWSSLEDPLHVFECESPEKCPGGSPGASCSALLSGQACTQCEGGKYWDGTTCAECISSPLLFPILPALLVPLLVLLINKGSHGGMRSWDSMKNVGAILVYILLCHYQNVTLLRFGAKDLPSRVYGIFDFWSFSNDIFDLFKTNCIGYDTFQARTISGLLLPLAVIILTLMTMGGTRLMAAATRKEHLRMTFDETHHIIGTFIFAFFNGLVGNCLNMFDCRLNPNGMYTVASNRNIICYESGAWNDMLAMAIPFTFFYCGGLTMAAFLAIFMARRNENFDRVGFQVRWKFLFGKYRPSTFWFGLVSLTRCTLLNIGLVAINGDLGKLYWFFSVIMFYTCFLVGALPFRGINCNRLDLMCSLCLIYECVVLVQFTRDSTGLETSVSYMMICFVLLPFASLIFVAIQLLRRMLCRKDDGRESLFVRLKECCSAIAFMPEDVGTEAVEGKGEWDKHIIVSFCSLIEAEVHGRNAKRLTSRRMTRICKSAAKESADMVQKVQSDLSRNSPHLPATPQQLRATGKIAVVEL